MKLPDVLALIGITLISTGLYFIYHPLPLLFLGVISITAAAFLTNNVDSEKDS